MVKAFMPHIIWHGCSPAGWFLGMLLILLRYIHSSHWRPFEGRGVCSTGEIPRSLPLWPDAHPQGRSKNSGFSLVCLQLLCPTPHLWCVFIELCPEKPAVTELWWDENRPFVTTGRSRLKPKSLAEAGWHFSLQELTPRKCALMCFAWCCFSLPTRWGTFDGMRVVKVMFVAESPDSLHMTIDLSFPVKLSCEALWRVSSRCTAVQKAIWRREQTASKRTDLTLGENWICLVEEIWTSWLLTEPFFLISCSTQQLWILLGCVLLAQAEGSDDGMYIFTWCHQDRWKSLWLPSTRFLQRSGFASSSLLKGGGKRTRSAAIPAPFFRHNGAVTKLFRRCRRHQGAPTESKIVQFIWNQSFSMPICAFEAVVSGATDFCSIHSSMRLDSPPKKQLVGGPPNFWEARRRSIWMFAHRRGAEEIPRVRDHRSYLQSCRGVFCPLQSNANMFVKCWKFKLS